MILSIYNSTSNIVVFWHKCSRFLIFMFVDQLLINKHENKKCGNYYSHKSLSKTVTLLYIITGTVRFYNYYIKGMPKIQTKRFLWIAFHHFPLLIDKITWSLTIFIDWVFYLLATPGSNYTRNWGYFEWAADLYFEKLGKIENLANISHPKKTLKQVLKKR